MGRDLNGVWPHDGHVYGWFVELDERHLEKGPFGVMLRAEVRHWCHENLNGIWLRGTRVIELTDEQIAANHRAAELSRTFGRPVAATHCVRTARIMEFETERDAALFKVFWC